MKKIVNSPLAPAAIGPYSQAVIVNDTIYVSGQLPIDAQTGEFVEGTLKDKFTQIFKNIGYILNEGGFDFCDVVKTTVYLTDMSNFAEMNEVYAQFFKEPYPARVAYAVKTLPKNSVAEVEVIASK